MVNIYVCHNSSRFIALKSLDPTADLTSGRYRKEEVQLKTLEVSVLNAWKKRLPWRVRRPEIPKEIPVFERKKTRNEVDNLIEGAVKNN